MSTGEIQLHNHSGLEKEIRFPKRFVLVDTSFRDRFNPNRIENFSTTINGKKLNFIKVPTLDFIKKGGVFRNLTYQL